MDRKKLIKILELTDKIDLIALEEIKIKNKKLYELMFRNINSIKKLIKKELD